MGAIRQLRPGERIPRGVPLRFPNLNLGYVRLRWRVGKGQYVEVYEHRVKGGKVTTAPIVERINGQKDDNRPENLLMRTNEERVRDYMTALEIDPIPLLRMYQHGWTFAQIVYDAHLPPEIVVRVLKRGGLKIKAPQTPVRSLLEQNKDVVISLLDSGASWKEVARRYELNSSAVTKVLKSWGLTPTYRPFNEQRYVRA